MAKAKTKKTINKTAVIISIIIIIASLIITIDNYKVSESIQKQEYESYVIVSDKGGFDLTPGIISFGQLRPGDSSTRKVYLNNTQNKKVIVKAEAEGRIKQLFIEKTEVLEPYENKTIDLVVRAPIGTELGRYEGRIIITTRKKGIIG